MNDRNELTSHVSQIPGVCPTFPLWCDNGPEPHTEHHGVPDMPPISATAESTDLRDEDGGVLATKVSVALWQDTEYRPTEAGALPDQLQVTLMIQRPDGREAEAHMTLHEADFLRRHLVQAIRDASQS
jgi:hypothetical protein